jgi:hypothetical protein
MKSYTRFIAVLTIMLLATASAIAATVTAATGGTGIPGTKAVNGTSPAFTTIGNFGLTTGNNNSEIAKNTSWTCVFTAPTNWKFNPGVGTVTYTVAGSGVTATITVTATTITVSGTSNNTNNAADAITISGIQVQADDGSITTPANIVMTSTTGTAFTGVTLNSTNFGTLSSDGTVPVELTTFNALAKGKGIELTWKTATEVNNAGFEVQKNVNGTWNKIAFVEGNGTSNTPHQYSYIDADAVGTVSYRLKQIDRDGQFEYSSVVEANAGFTAADYKLGQNYPNPFNPTTNITFVMQNSENVTVKVYNLVGQEVATLFNGVAEANKMYTLNFDASKLSAGTYFYALHSASRNEVKKMSLIK